MSCHVMSCHIPSHPNTSHLTKPPHHTLPHQTQYHSISHVDCTCQPEAEGSASGYGVAQAHTLCARRRVRTSGSTHWTVIQTLACTCSLCMCKVIDMIIFILILMLMSMLMLMFMPAIVSALILFYLSCNDCKYIFNSKREIK
jgi:hypothetical protein